MNKPRTATRNLHVSPKLPGSDSSNLVWIIARRAIPPAAALSGLMLAGAAQAATITVSAGAVDTVVNGNCSLVEAVQSANSDTAVDGCVAGSAGLDTLVLPPITFSFSSADVSSTSYGSNALPSISSPISIQGNGAIIERSAAAGTPDFRLFHVSTAGSLALDRVTLRNGVSSGGGGAIANISGVLNLTNSTISGNSAATLGGGILAISFYGTQTTGISNSTISGNTASGAGGGIAYSGGLGTVSHSTITGNSAPQGGGIFIAQSDGQPPASLAVRASIVAGNPATDVDRFGTAAEASFVSGGDNVIGTGNATGQFNADGDIVDVADPGLGVLADNGGGTLTHLPTIGSQALGRADNNACPVSDQRGQARGLDNDNGLVVNCDSGAVERSVPILVDAAAVAVASGDGECSLLEAIVNANDINNEGQPHTDCQRGVVGGLDIIQLPGGSLFTLSQAFGDGYGNNSGLPAITSDIVIQGNGSVLERDGGAATNFRIAFVDFLGDLTLEDITLRGGQLAGAENTNAGGGLLSFGTVSLKNSSITGNTVGSSATGAGVFVATSFGNLRVERSTISDNSAGQAGALAVGADATVLLNTSTISGNAAGFAGGLINDGELSIVHTTLANNDSAAVANLSYGSIAVTNSLIVGNDGITCYSQNANLVFTGTNVSNDAGCSGFIISPEAASLLAPLGDNGGPTQTHLPMAGHPAIDAVPTTGSGACAVPSIGQRGVSRPQNGGAAAACDVGAVEVIDPIVVSGACTLVQAINNANDTVDGQANTDCAAGSPAGPDIITLPNGGTYTYTAANNSVDGDNALPSITSGITIQGNDATIERSSAYGTGTFRLIHVASSGDVRMNSLTLQGGVADDGGGYGYESSGGAAFVRGSLALTGGTVSGNSAQYVGGGIFNVGNAKLDSSTVSGNTAYRDGGGIINAFGTTALTNSTVSGNFAGIRGGGIFNRQSTTTLTNSTVSGNSSGFAGGGLYNLANMALANSTVSSNTADNSGGGIDSSSSSVALSNSVVAGNAALTGAELVGQPYGGGSDANNLLGHAGLTTGQAFSDFSPGASDITATSDGTSPTALTDIRLPLANNGGVTATHGLPANSPAVDAAGGACGSDPEFDQIGTVRPQDGNLDQQVRCDIGAVERIADAVTDTDNDNIPDDYEIAFGLNPGVDDSDGDLDGDNLSNGEEFANGAQANNPDSDGDFIGDGFDLDPTNDSNACVADNFGPAGAMQFDTMAMAAMTTQCASESQITIRATATLETPNAELELFAPTVIFDVNVAVPLGPQLRVNAVDPTPGATP